MNSSREESSTRGILDNRLLRGAVSVLTTILLAISLVGVGLFVCSADITTKILSESFSRWEGSSFSQEQVVEAAIATKDYTVGDNDLNKLISEFESIFEISNTSYVLDAEALDHLDDVFKVVDTARGVIIVITVIAVCLCFLIGFMAGRGLLGSILRAASLFVIILFSLIAVWCVMDFNGFFTLLHSLFFTEGTWLFDADSLLIRMYPIQFWIGMGVVWLCTTLLCCLICFILGRKIRGRKRLSMTYSISHENIRVRFAPSPTGMLHIGGARTAIFNWAFARSIGGRFILRIEDTDPERSTEENTQIIIRALRWLGLDWDEGPEIGGDAGPYFQSQRSESYQAALKTLIERNAVYPCFCSKEALDLKRTEAEKNEGGYAGYDRTCRDLDRTEVQRRLDAGNPCVWRLKVPLDREAITFDDAVHGKVNFPSEVMDDMILVRSDATPTYNFAVVCDDANMQISHVIRGDDHLSNTPRQILIYEALGLTPPIFAHLSMILGVDGKKLSKRHGATSVEEYRDRGYLSDALVNFLALLGWSLDGETTIISRETLTKTFGLDRITKKDAIFDETKLDWMNGAYIRELDASTWLKLSQDWLIQAGADMNDIEARPEWYERLYPLVSERLVRLDEIPAKLNFFFWKVVEFDETSVKKVLLKEGSRADEALRACRKVLADESIPWECDPLQEACRTRTETLGMKAKFIFQPLRVAVCGNMVSPPLFESIELMSRANVLSRIDSCLEEVFGD